MLHDAARPRVSRETRRLLAAAGLALLALWVLARLRFPERPPSPNPVSPVLTQISPPTTFADLAGEAEEVMQRVTSVLSHVTWQTPGRPGEAQTFPAWPLHDDLAIAMLPSTLAASPGNRVVARDPPTGLALVRAITPADGTRPIWVPDRLELPRYVFSVAPAPSRPSVIPEYVSSLEPLRSPAWSSEIWRVPAASSLPPGTFIFTAAGEWLGIAGEENGQSVIVSAAAVLDRAARMDARRDPPGGDLGIHVQSLTPPLAIATGAATGVIVSFVDSAGPAAKALAVGDVIEQLNGEALPTAFAWHVRSTRLAAGAPARLHVYRRGQVMDVAVAVPAAAVARPGVLGLTMAREPRAGSRVLQVLPGTAADRALLQAGDLITLAGEQAAPTPAQVRRSFEAIPDGGVVLFAITREANHRLVVLTR